MSKSAQEVNVSRQREDVRTRVTSAITSMHAEIDSARKRGLAVRHLLRSAVLRRAGNIDKNTLKQPYHASIEQASIEQVEEAIKNISDVAAQLGSKLAHKCGLRATEISELTVEDVFNPI